MRALFATLIILMACSSPTSPSDSWQLELDAAEARWAAAGLLNYDYHFRYLCGFCPPSAVSERLVTVRNSIVVSVRDVEADTLFTGDLSGSLMGAQFARVQGLIDIPAATLHVEYDPVHGYPVSLSADPIAAAVDEEGGFELWGFVALP